MPTISHVVSHIVDGRPLLQEAILEDIVSYGALAENIKSEIEKELGKKVKHSAVVMALRRCSEKLKKISIKKKGFNFKSEIVMKTNLCDVGVVKSLSLFKKFKEIYSLIDFEKGETLNVIQGNYEVAIITNEKYLSKIKEILSDEKIIRTEKNLVMIGLNFPKEYSDQPGVIAAITRKLAWNGVNILEVISTFKELNFVVSKRDATKAYNALEELAAI